MRVLKRLYRMETEWIESCHDFLGYLKERSIANVDSVFKYSHEQALV